MKPLDYRKLVQLPSAQIEQILLRRNRIKAGKWLILAFTPFIIWAVVVGIVLLTK